jgi:NADPH-dependent 2,4-dienoyl-CoA reductase/sulfur reductase-like enzyme
VIGAGPAGLEAAISAGETGVKTVLIDQQPGPGGQYYARPPAEFRQAKKTKSDQEAELLVQLLDGLPVVKRYRACAWGIFPQGGGAGWQILLYGEDAPKQLVASTLVLATGAYDTPVAFPGWTLPGVITAGAALALLKHQRVAPGKRAVVCGSGPLVLSAAAHLIDAGVEVAGVYEAARLLPKGLRYAPTMLGQGHRISEGMAYLTRMLRAGARYHTGWTILEARGDGQVEEALVARLDAQGMPVPGSEQRLAVDTVVCGFHLAPDTGIARMIGCELAYRPKQGGWVPVRDEVMQTSLPGVYAAGDGAGIGGAENARLEGILAGTAAAVRLGCLDEKRAGEIYGRLKPQLARQRAFARMVGEVFTPAPSLIGLARDDTLICRCEEITLGEVKAAVAQGARTLGEVKNITRTGMGNCQGRMCEHSVAGAIVQVLAAENATRETVGRYSIRPPLHPLPLGVLAEAGETGE